jgi:excisionase family DNA binding protein
VANSQQVPSSAHFYDADASHNSARNPLMSERQAAQFLGVSPTTLQAWRTTGRVRLAYVKLGRSVRYRLADLEDFAEAQRRTTTA